MSVTVKKIGGKAVVIEKEPKVLVELKDFQHGRPKAIKFKPNKPRSG